MTDPRAQERQEIRALREWLDAERRRTHQVEEALAQIRDAKGSNGERLNAMPACPKCDSTDGHLGTSNAYFYCRACQTAQYWTANHEHPTDWAVAVAVSPFGRRSVLLEHLRAVEQARDATLERVVWFEKSGGVAAHTRVFQEIARADRAELRLTRLTEGLQHLQATCAANPYSTVAESVTQILSALLAETEPKG